MRFWSALNLHSHRGVITKEGWSRRGEIAYAKIMYIYFQGSLSFCVEGAHHEDPKIQSRLWMTWSTGAARFSVAFDWQRRYALLQLVLRLV